MSMAVRLGVLEYGLYGVPCECRAALINGFRGHNYFRTHALPLFFNLFAEEAQLVDARRRLLEYVANCQHDYYLVLQRVMPNRQYQWPGASVVWEHDLLRRNQEILLQMEGNKPKVPFDQYFRSMLKEVDVGPIFTEELKVAIAKAREAYFIFGTFVSYRTVILKHEELLPTYLHYRGPVSEIMAAFTHVSRGYMYFLLNEIGTCSAEIKAAIVHLTRVTLDMRKAIVISGCKEELYKKVNNIGALLTVREHEILLACDDNAKTNLYQQECADFMEYYGL